jgi:type II secretory pathway pseudopilin PulG
VGTLFETTIAIGILATVAGATLGVSAMASHAAANAAMRGVMQDAAEGEMRVALDVLKYQGGALAPASIATTLPLASASPLPVRISVSSSVAPDGATSITVGVVAIGDPTQQIALTGTLDRRAPLPGSILHAPGLAAAPTGAP